MVVFLLILLIIRRRRQYGKGGTYQDYSDTNLLTSIQLRNDAGGVVFAGEIVLVCYLHNKDNE